MLLARRCRVAGAPGAAPLPSAGMAAFGFAPTPRAAAADVMLNPHRLAKVVVGISKARVQSLLGAPWRTIRYNDEETPENEIWEYRGKDVSGPYRLHLEFDPQGKLSVVSKVPDPPNAP